MFLFIWFFQWKIDTLNDLCLYFEEFFPSKILTDEKFLSLLNIKICRQSFHANLSFIQIDDEKNIDWFLFYFIRTFVFFLSIEQENLSFVNEWAELIKKIHNSMKRSSSN